MKTLFDESSIGTLKLKNRFIRSATHLSLAEKDCHVSEKLLNAYEDLAQGGVGTIITGFAHAFVEEQPAVKMIGAYDDKFIPDFNKITESVHKHDCNIIMQLAYGGSQSKLLKAKRKIWGPSAVEHIFTGIKPIEMTKQDFKTFSEKFGDAALRVKKGGFDGVQLHCAHGYMLSQCLSPYHNRRTDEYGGSIENRARIIFETYENMRKKVGDDFPILIKINCSDFMGEDGLQLEECKVLCKKLAEMGLDAIEISGNVAYNENAPLIFEKKISRDKSRQSYFSKYAAEIAAEIDIPLIVVGGNRSIDVMTDILNSTDISYFSLSRTLLSEPDLIKKWKDNEDYNPKCVACNKCWSLKGNICILNR